MYHSDGGLPFAVSLPRANGFSDRVAGPRIEDRELAARERILGVSTGEGSASHAPRG
jgi:hypothetical protein